MRQPGVEPGSTAWKATMLTVTPLTPHVFLFWIGRSGELTISNYTFSGFNWTPLEIWYNFVINRYSYSIICAYFIIMHTNHCVSDVTKIIPPDVTAGWLTSGQVLDSDKEADKMAQTLFEALAGKKTQLNGKFTILVEHLLMSNESTLPVLPLSS